ncbi:MAG TPA: YIP1 family protein [Spirochaetota bacterium]|nr:YIP1 family protein [Spirochaetota bacterium]HPI90071.1 YIP1 family protein [Spirochaetota bacterium]HPR47858.1 YIP1 family protein [Spirochaetota bacterium]
MILAKFKSLLWTDFFLYTIVDPRSLYRQIGKNDPKPFLLSFTVPAITSLAGILTQSLLSVQSSFFYTKITYGWILVFIFDSFLIIISAALMDMLAQLLGNKGNIREMISLINYSHLPRAFILPIVYIFVILQFAPVFMYVFFSTVLFIWSAFIAILGISEMHSLDTGKSLLIFIFPYLFTSVSFFFMIFLAVVSALSYLV